MAKPARTTPTPHRDAAGASSGVTTHAPKRRVVIGLLGTTLDAGKGADRWSRWRPTVGLCMQPDWLVDRLDLIHQSKVVDMTRQVEADIASVSPETRVVRHAMDVANPWDFESVYAALHDFAAAYPFDTEHEDYFVHITTGTHVAQICLFLLAESRRFPARLVQTSPTRGQRNPAGTTSVIDLDLSRYDVIASRFAREARGNVLGLKGGIETRNARFNRLIEQLEHVAIHASDPILLMGATGAGKSRLARRIYDLRHARHQAPGPFVEVNCATLRGDGAMSTLFGHTRGAFTGAAADRPGLLRTADGGVLFLDEIGELKADEQAMLLRALEEKRFLPLGSDKEVSSSFQLIAGTNRDLAAEVRAGRFREDLLARINLWTFRLPSLRERPEDIEPNIEHELEARAARTNRLVRFSAEARAHYLRFATSPEASWPGNFRDLSASISRMTTLAPGGRISEELALEEIERLRQAWSAGNGASTGTEATNQSAPVTSAAAAREPSSRDADLLTRFISPAQIQSLDRFDRVQLIDVLSVCTRAASLSEAGRILFAASRAAKQSHNDADRLRKYLARFGVSWKMVRAAATEQSGRVVKW
jgi:transcriptional regulatory protein RtcR